MPVIQVRPETRQAWDALKAAGSTPSVRQVYEHVGGAYNVVAAECRVLRTGEQRPPVAAESSAPWYPPAVRQALLALCEAIRTDARTYRHYIALARRLQGSTRGLLSDLVEAMRKG